MDKLSHAKRRALRDAVLTGGLFRYGDSWLHFNPKRPDVFYQSNTICSLVAEGLLTFRTEAGRAVAKATAAGLAELQGSWRPAGAEIPAGAIAE